MGKHSIFLTVEYDGTNPEQLNAVVGKIVEACWVLPDSFFVLFRDGAVLDIRAIRVVGFAALLAFKVGQSKPGTDWYSLLKDRQRPWTCRELEGLPFQGMDGNVFVFGPNLGVRITPDGIRILHRSQHMNGRGKIIPETPEEKIARLEARTADLLSGMYVNCVYCGHRYGPESETPVAMAEVLKAHIAQCPEHPMSGLIRAATGAWYLCQSLLVARYAATDDLIAECRDVLEAALVRAGRTP